MSDKVFDLFYKKGKAGKTKYVGSMWEGKFADEQRAEGKEPWLDLNLSILKDGKRFYAKSIDFGAAGKLTLGKESGVYVKAGICKGLTIAEVDGDEFVGGDTDEDEGETTAVVDTDDEDALDTSELE